MIEENKVKGFLKACIFLFLVALLSLSSLSYASSQEELNYEISYSMNITILHDSSINERISIRIENYGSLSIPELIYELPENAKNIEILEEREKANYTLQKIDNKTSASIILKNPIKKGEKREIVVSFKLSDVVENLGDERIFSMIFKLPANVKKFSLQIKLPPGMVVKREAASPDIANIAPLPDEMTTDGESIILRWERGGIDKFSVFVRYSEPASENSVKIKTNESSALKHEGQSKVRTVVYSGMIILLIAIAAVTIYLRKKAEKDKEKSEEGEQKEKLIHFLKEDEARVIEIVKSMPGINQKKIAELTNYSKSKISKLIAELERREIVRTEKIGRKVKVYLREDFENALKKER